MTPAEPLSAEEVCDCALSTHRCEDWVRRAAREPAGAGLLLELRAAIDGLAADCRCADDVDVCERHHELCMDGTCEDSPEWKRPVLALIDAALATSPAEPGLDVEEVRHQAVRDAIRRLPNVLAVYETTNAAALALLLADGAPLANAIVEDVWDGVRKGWPALSEPKP